MTARAPLNNRRLKSWSIEPDSDDNSEEFDADDNLTSTPKTKSAENTFDSSPRISMKKTATISILLLVVAIILGLIFTNITKIVGLIFKNPTKNLTCDLKDSLKNNRINEDLIFSVSTVFELSQRNFKTTGVFLLLHRPQAHIEPFVTDLTKELSACFNTEPARLRKSDFNQCPNDIGCVITHYRKLGEQHCVFVVDKLNELSLDSAHILHVICDTQDSIIRPSMIFLTLEITTEYDDDSPSNAKRTASDRLNDLWSEMHANERDMLIARVTDQVYWVSA